MSIKSLFTTWDELTTYSTTKPEILLIIKCGAQWCAPCKMIKPFYEYLCENYPNVNFYELDIDDEQYESILQNMDIAKVPTFIYIKNGIVKYTIIGTNKENIENAIIEYL